MPINVLWKKLDLTPIKKSLNIFKSLFLISLPIQYNEEQNTTGIGIQKTKNKGIYLGISFTPINTINNNNGILNNTQNRFIHKK